MKTKRTGHAAGMFTAVMILMVVSIIIWLPVSGDIDSWGEDMWHLAFLLAGVPARTVLEYGQFPFWNPYISGGQPMLAYPMSSFLSPSFGLPVAFGPVVGQKLRILFFLYIGLCGGFFLGRMIAPGRVSPYLCSFIYMLSSWYPLYMSHWHDWFMAFAYLPWLLFFCLKAGENVRWSAGAGLVMALMFLDGGTYPLVYSVLLILIYAFIESLLSRSIRLIGVVLLVLMLGLLVGAVKLLPMAEFLSRYPRLTAWWEPVLPLRALPRMFLGHDQLSPTSFKGGWLGWWEYGAYVGWIALVLAGLSVVLQRRRAAPLAIAGLIFFLLMFGDYGLWSPWHWLHKVPPFSSMHDPVRFRIVVVFCLSVMAAIALSGLEDVSLSLKGRGRRDLVYSGVCLLSVVVFIDLFIVSSPIYCRVSTRPPLQPERAGPFRQKRLPKEEQQGPLSFMCFLENEGLVNSYNPMFPPDVAVTAYNDPGYRGEVWLLNGRGKVETLKWSPNRLKYGVKLSEPDILMVNQRYDPGWKTEDGRSVGSLRGIIAIEVGPDDAEVELFYRPPYFIAGLVITIAGLTACAMLAIRKSRSFNGDGVGV